MTIWTSFRLQPNRLRHRRSLVPSIRFPEVRIPPIHRRASPKRRIPARRIPLNRIRRREVRPRWLRFLRWRISPWMPQLPRVREYTFANNPRTREARTKGRAPIVATHCRSNATPGIPERDLSKPHPNSLHPPQRISQNRHRGRGRGGGRRWCRRRLTAAAIPQHDKVPPETKAETADS